MGFKEYSKNDFFYYKFGTTDASCNNVKLDDLIDSSCKSYAGRIDVNLNGIEYQVTPNNDTINTIKEIAEKFTEISPYIFSYTSDNKLIVKSAKIKFATAINNSASKFLGYEESNVDHELPYMFPNIIKTTYNDTDGNINKDKYEYSFDSSYNFGPVDIRATSANQYYKVTGISINTDTKTNVRYINPYSLIEHLNNNKIGFASTTVSDAPKLTIDSNNLYYKFEYVSMYDKLKVDLMCQETSTLTDNKLTITIDSKEYTYTITIPNDSVSVASTSSDIIYDTSSFRYWKTDDTTSKTKITPPTVIFEQKTITVVFNATKKAFVCNILPDFALEFKATSSPTLVYSASKYVEVESNKDKYKYDKLPYTLPNAYGTTRSTNISECIPAKQNKALCDNKSYADKLMALTTTHPGASERYDNIRGFTSMSILNIFNLGIGIVAAGVFIAQTYK